MSVRDRLRLSFCLAVLCVFAYAGVEALDFSRRARYMPLYVSAGGFVLSSLLIFLEFWRMRSAAGRAMRRGVAIEDLAAEDMFSPEEERHRLKTTSYYLLWMVGYIGVIALVGLPAASALFLAGFLLIEARMKLPAIALSVAAMLAGLLTLTHLMHLRWPSSLLGW
jgi:hypothetical protein